MQEETHTCAYCGAPATHQFKNGKWCCQDKKSQCPEMRRHFSDKTTLIHQRFKEKFGSSKLQRGQSLGLGQSYSRKCPSKGDHVCVYCGGYADYQLKDGRWCCQPNANSCPEIRRKMSEGLKKSYATGRRVSANKGKPSWNKGLTKETDARVAKGVESIKEGYASGRLTGTWKGKHHTEEFKQKQRINALNQHLGGFHMRKGVDYNGIKLDSTYEVTLAQDLDRNGIKWERCKRFPYHMNGKLHHYTPDFYLPDYGVYLDPKNDFLIEHVNPRLGFKDSDKIAQAEKENGIRVLVLNQHQLSWEFIKQQL